MVRACKYAVVVGAVLITINHGDALLAGDVDGRRLLKIGLTVLVPYAVSTLSSVGATLALRRAGRARPRPNIPARIPHAVSRPSTEHATATQPKRRWRRS